MKIAIICIIIYLLIGIMSYISGMVMFFCLKKDTRTTKQLKWLKVFINITVGWPILLLIGFFMINEEHKKEMEKQKIIDESIDEIKKEEELRNFYENN